MNYQLINQTRQCKVAQQVTLAVTFWTRLRGWLFRGQPQAGEGLYLAPCRAVHSLGLTFAVDAVYLDRQQRVLAVETLRPGRVGSWHKGTRAILELPAGTGLACCGPGDQLIWEREVYEERSHE